jgi:hypothetical protein
MQELYGVKIAGEMRIATDPAETRNDEEHGVNMPYCGDAPDRADLPGCPFCGSENLLIDQDSEGWFVECNGCMAEGPRAPTQDEAERRWSIRR